VTWFVDSTLVGMARESTLRGTRQGSCLRLGLVVVVAVVAATVAVAVVVAVVAAQMIDSLVDS